MGDKIKVVLNPFERDMNCREVVEVGDMIEANLYGAEFNLTPLRQYKLLGYDGDCIKVKNDLGSEEWYSRDYFRKIY